MVFDDAAPLPDGRPGFFAPYFSREVVVMEEAHDYIDETTTVANARRPIPGYIRWAISSRAF
jgi:hypothetical protein